MLFMSFESTSARNLHSLIASFCLAEIFETHFEPLFDSLFRVRYRRKTEPWNSVSIIKPFYRAWWLRKLLKRSLKFAFPCVQCAFSPRTSKIGRAADTILFISTSPSLLTAIHYLKTRAELELEIAIRVLESVKEINVFIKAILEYPYHNNRRCKII